MLLSAVALPTVAVNSVRTQVCLMAGRLAGNVRLILASMRMTLPTYDKELGIPLPSRKPSKAVNGSPRFELLS